MNITKKRKKLGFSLAEMMIVVAIILILAGLGFVAVTRYLRIFKHFEYDNVAKEIFISAQNHLSMAFNEGYLTREHDGTFEGNKVEESKDKEIYYYVVTNDESDYSSDVNDKSSVLNLMLPFGSIDETVRTNGSYIIRYDKKTARVLDVFYSEKKGTRFGHTFLDLYEEGDEEDSLMDLRDDKFKERRRKYILEENGRESIVGFYGGDNVVLVYGKELKTPFLRVINAETLSVEVTVSEPIPEKAKLKLYVTSKNDPNKVKVIELTNPTNNKYVYVIDDITKKGGHFKDLFPEFTPGENIEIYAEISNNEELTNIAKSITVTTNSIFGDDSTDTKADISNIRHLENLDPKVSGLTLTSISLAEQSSDLDWEEFLSKVGTGSSITKPGNDANVELTGPGKYYPVEMPVHLKAYNGAYHQIAKVDASAGGNVGLFSLVGGKTIENLELIDFQINATGMYGYGGALAGKLSAATVNNVAVHDSVLGTKKSNIYGSTGAGGLVGATDEMALDKINESLASVVVSGNSYVGGLVGYANNAQINKCYSGGHTDNGKYKKNSFDVTASTGYAGGLVGYATGTDISYSYSTCSVDGVTAGGLAGNFGGGTLSDSYAVGYIKLTLSGKEYDVTNKGALVGENSGGSYSNCQYLKIASNGLLAGIYNSADTVNIKAMDERDSSYSAKDNYARFLSDYINNMSISILGVDALPYDSFLIEKYHYKFLYRGIKELCGTAPSEKKYVSKHFGDWPSYETFVINLPN